MSDRRLTPFNGRVAALSLRGTVDAPQFVAGDWQRVSQPVADLLARPDGPRDRQLLLGERFLVLDRDAGFAFGQAERDGYVGWLALNALGPDAAATHWVTAPGTHAYPAATIKQGERAALSFGSRVTVVAEHPQFLETDAGWFLPRQHLAPIGQHLTDPVSVAALFLGTPYLWGGNSRMGVDCSGLVQAAHLACGLPCPGDSDLQEEGFGTALPEGSAWQRGDLLFWKGHVALIADADRILHANGHHMATAYEDTAAAIARIEAQGGGPVTAHKRL